MTTVPAPVPAPLELAVSNSQTVRLEHPGRERAAVLAPQIDRYLTRLEVTPAGGPLHGALMLACCTITETVITSARVRGPVPARDRRLAAELACGLLFDRCLADMTGPMAAPGTAPLVAELLTLLHDWLTIDPEACHGVCC